MSFDTSFPTSSSCSKMSTLNLTPHQTQNGVVLNAVLNRCPEGTKAFVLCLGYLQADAGFFLRGGNTSTMGNPDGPAKHERRDLIMYTVLIDHPAEGVILWEVGSGKDYPEIWPQGINDVFSRSRYEPEHELDAAMAKVGYKISDVKKILIGHLHLDHASGLEAFFGNTEVEIWVHERELKSAFYSVATGADAGVYLPHYLRFDFNWKTFDERTTDFAQGLTLHHFPGHTDGLCGLQLNLINDGTFFFVSDHAHVKENLEGTPQGWLARDHPAWFNSNQRLQRLQKMTGGKVIPGHDEPIVSTLLEFDDG